MTNADKFKQTFRLYATELWAKPESEFLTWLNAEYVPFDIKPFICRKCGKKYLAKTVRHYDEEFDINCWTSICPSCGAENEINDCYWR
jgi:ribosomal protein L40E